MTIHVSFLVSFLALINISSLCCAQKKVEGDWIGGFDRKAESIFLRVRFNREDGQLQGTCDISGESLFLDKGKQLSSVKAEDDRIRFMIHRKAGELVFDGTLADERIEGSVTQNETKSAFSLTRIISVDASRYRGVYRYRTPSRDSIAYIGQATIYEDVLFFLNAETGAFDVLFPISETTFFAGPSLLATRPEKLRIKFSFDDEKRISSYSFTKPGQPSLIADRVTYKQEEITFNSQGISLEGTLISPISRGPHPVIVFAPASTGLSTREMSRMYAEYFAYYGVAGFIYDKRGTGTSKGNWLEASFDVLSDDTLSAFRMLKGREDVDSKCIGLFGGSQGGWVVGLAASRSAEVAFIISQSGPGVTPEEQELYRTENWLRADGFDETDIEEALAFTRYRYECARTGKGWAHLSKMDSDAKNAAWAGYVGVGVGGDSPFWKFSISYGTMTRLRRCEKLNAQFSQSSVNATLFFPSKKVSACGVSRYEKRATTM